MAPAGRHFPSVRWLMKVRIERSDRVDVDTQAQDCSLSVGSRASVDGGQADAVPDLL